MQQQSVPVSQQIQQLNQQLTQAFVQKEEAHLRLAEAEKNIVALRNVLAGVGLGQKLAAEIAVEGAAAP